MEVAMTEYTIVGQINIGVLCARNTASRLYRHDFGLYVKGRGSHRQRLVPRSDASVIIIIIIIIAPLN